MSVYRSAEGERLVRERYLSLIACWPVPHEQIRVPTSQGETFVVASGAAGAPPVLLLHGSAGNSAMWMRDVRALSEHFRVYAVDLIGEAGLSAPSRPPLHSDAHARWLDDVLDALALDRVSLVGTSLGGWVALDYATRRSGRVARVAVTCPGGVGRQKFGVVVVALVLRMCGARGKRKLTELVLGRASSNPSPAVRAFTDFVALIHQHFRPRMARLPIFSDDALRRLQMPTLAIVGGRDVLIASHETRDRLERSAPGAEVVYLPSAGHMIAGQTDRVISFLLRQRAATGTGVSHSRSGPAASVPATE